MIRLQAEGVTVRHEDVFAVVRGTVVSAPNQNLGFRAGTSPSGSTVNVTRGQSS
jgi:hypothetical protein